MAVMSAEKKRPLQRSPLFSAYRLVSARDLQFRQELVDGQIGVTDQRKRVSQGGGVLTTVEFSGGVVDEGEVVTLFERMTTGAFDTFVRSQATEGDLLDTASLQFFLHVSAAER